MAIKFELVKVGDVLYQKVRQKAGNTMMSREGVYHCEIVSVDEHGAMVKWNGNPPKRWHTRDVEKLSRKKPTVRQGYF